jgi:hypothetical protein
VSDESEPDSYVEFIKSMALDEKIDFDSAKSLIQEYRKLHLDNKGELEC